MKKTITTLSLVFTASLVFGQSNYEQFKKLYQAKDTAKTKALLVDWEKSNPNDPELYTSAFNYYFSTSQHEIIVLEKEQRGKESLQPNDSTGKLSGFMNSTLSYNQEKLKKAFYYVDKGIEKFPNRLDIRFGKCYVLGLLEEYNEFTSEIINTVEYSKKIKCIWLWTENEKLDDAENFMLGSIHSYLKQLYDTENDDLLENMKKIGDLTLAYYPKCVEILSTTSIAYLLTKNYDKAIEYLKQAETVDPKDIIVLSNIAQAYKRKGDKENAIKYFELVSKYGDEQAKKEANDFIKALKTTK